MHTLMLVCEVVIGLVGAAAIFYEEKWDNKLHGVFVVLLCLNGICGHIFGEEAIISDMTLIIAAIYAVVFIILCIPQIKKKVRKIKEKRIGNGKER